MYIRTFTLSGCPLLTEAGEELYSARHSLTEIVQKEKAATTTAIVEAARENTIC